MIDAAQKLGQDIDFARIDLYNTTKGIILGEMTIYPERGIIATPTACPAFNKWLGDQWKLRTLDTVSAFCLNAAYGLKLYANRFSN